MFWFLISRTYLLCFFSSTQIVPTDFTDQHLYDQGSHIVTLYEEGVQKPLWKVRLVREDNTFLLGDGWSEFVARTIPPAVRWLLITFKYKGKQKFVIGAYMPNGDPVDVVTGLGQTSSPPPLHRIELLPSFAVQLHSSTRTPFAQVKSKSLYLACYIGLEYNIGVYSSFRTICLFLISNLV